MKRKGGQKTFSRKLKNIYCQIICQTVIASASTTNTIIMLEKRQFNVYLLNSRLYLCTKCNRYTACPKSME